MNAHSKLERLRKRREQLAQVLSALDKEIEELATSTAAMSPGQKITRDMRTVAEAMPHGRKMTREEILQSLLASHRTSARPKRLPSVPNALIALRKAGIVEKTGYSRAARYTRVRELPT